MSTEHRVVERVQTGIRIEKRLLKVLKGLAETLDVTVGDLLEGVLLHAFEGKAPFSQQQIARIHGMDPKKGLGRAPRSESAERAGSDIKKQFFARNVNRHNSDSKHCAPRTTIQPPTPPPSKWRHQQEAAETFIANLKRFAAAQGKPERYHETISLAYLLLIHDRIVTRGRGATWSDFAEANPDLLAWQPSILDRYYSRDLLDSDLARRTFVGPDWGSDSSLTPV